MIKEKISSRLFICLFFIYTLSAFSKMAFSAVTAALINEAILTKTQAGIIGGAFWFIYALGQFAGGYLVNKYSPALMIKIAILGGATTNILLAFANSYSTFLIIWCLNAALQFGMWPGVLQLLSTKIIPEQKEKAFTYIAYCYAFGSILCHLLTAVVLKYLSWRYLFIWCAILGVASLLPVFYAEKLLPHLADENIPKKSEIKKEPLPTGYVWKSGLLLFCVLFFIKSILDMGIKTWMPTILMETFSVTPSYTSVLSTVLLVFNLFGVSAVALIYRKLKGNEVSTLLALYLYIFPLILSLIFLNSMNAIFATIIFSLVTIAIYGSTQVLSTYYSAHFHVWGKTAFIGGILNGFAAFGNVFAAFASSFVADLFGWNMTIYMWIGLTALFLILTIVLIPIWKNFKITNNIR